MFGWHIEDGRKTFPYLLQEMSDQVGREHTVYNLGQPGYSTAQGLALFEQWQDRLAPDVVVIYFGWNDLWPTPMLTDRQVMALLKLTDNRLVRAIKRTYTYGFVGKLLSATGLLPDRAASGSPTPAAARRVPQGESIENIRALTAGRRAIVILAPYCKKALERIESFNTAVRAALPEHVEFLRLPEMEFGAPQACSYFSDGFHPNEKGARYIAQALFEAIGR